MADDAQTSSPDAPRADLDLSHVHSARILENPPPSSEDAAGAAPKDTVSSAASKRRHALKNAYYDSPLPVAGTVSSKKSSKK